MRKKRISIIISIVLVVLLISSGFYLYLKIVSNKDMVEEMFRLNSDRRAEGYYMAQFEMQMVGILYYLDKGQYKEASLLLEKLHNQLKSGQGFIKLLVDNQGRDRYKEFPFRYKNEMANTTIKKLKQPMPESKTGQHELV